MPIKNSSLEKKWWYRLIKTILMLLPALIITRMFVTGKMIFPEITQANIDAVVNKNLKYLIYAIVGYSIYPLILYGIRSLIIYIGFGGMEYDTVKNDSRIKKSRLEKKCSIE